MNHISTEKAKIADELYSDGKLVAHNKEDHKIIGEVEIITESKVDGKRIFTKTIKYNDLLVGGSVYISEKINNVRSTFKTTPIDVELGVHTAEDITVDTSTISDELICGIMVGNEGTSDTYNTVRAVKRSARTVPGIIPFRVVPLNDDLKDNDREKYFLRKVIGDYVYYYGKKFEIEREINVLYEDGTVVPTNVDVVPLNKYIKTFTKYKITIEQSDIREYFKITQGSTLRSLINSIGLVTGYPTMDDEGNVEFCNVRTITTLNMENQELKDSESTITFIYRLYVL